MNLPLTRAQTHRIFLLAMILSGLIAFGATVAWREGLILAALESDSSRLTWLILLIYLLGSVRWLYLAYDISCKRSSLALGEPTRRSEGMDQILLSQESKVEAQAQLDVFADRLSKRNVSGRFLADLLLRLGLLGTIVGFILMLLPIGNIQDFDINLVQQLMIQMSAGMAVALYTTLSGLITSTLMKLQYLLVDDALVDLIHDLQEHVNRCSSP
ncbi:MAG: MotA/TolQ/ExbB proton channel family protein [Gemmatimonadota bacterium]|nr:MotA/TolQ/ExbB proton channel family protein [Gemmatimonadota bacterium]MDE3006927.1 MotA/TolQ/ExbB proton channel family protein [Gemmatimonadota bacterium]MDE3013554.1 MotA/TolQ/ExbB proton channel family protein [Gemmatimonadota bacterium]